MLNFGTFFLWTLAACLLWRGSLAEDRQSHFVCLLDDPDPNQCDSFCLNELRPLLKKVLKGQGQGITCDANNETKAKLDRLVGQEARLRSQFQGVEAKMEGRLHGLEAKMEGRPQEVKAKLQGVEAKLEGVEANLKGNLLAVQTSLETNFQAVLNQLQAVSKQIDVAKEVTAETVRKEIQKIPRGFEQIGSRYFKIVKEKVNWLTAERKCREMGGHLAAFRDEEEINAVTQKIQWGWTEYWLGLNDRDSEGRFVSVASNKPAEFLKWKKGEPNNRINNEDCVTLSNGEMWDDNCDNNVYFICQADNEI
ncbi:hypothetical protein KR054_004120 [Drosophila jambulina]|nr:hypothetical protein KR054_004120 [Drosophila jambulina]